MPANYCCWKRPRIFLSPKTKKRWRTWKRYASLLVPFRRRRREFLQFSKTKLAGTIHAAATAFVAGTDLNLRGGRDWNSHRHSAHAQKILAWSRAGHRQHHADDSQSGLVWLSDPAAFHWRHWRAHCDRCAGGLCVTADNSKHGHRYCGRRSKCARSSGSDGHDWPADSLASGTAFSDAGDHYWRARRNGDCDWRGNHCRRGRRRRARRLHLSWAETI